MAKPHTCGGDNRVTLCLQSLHDFVPTRGFGECAMHQYDGRLSNGARFRGIGGCGRTRVGYKLSEAEGDDSTERSE
jgi:hypothetical protein